MLIFIFLIFFELSIVTVAERGNRYRSPVTDPDGEGRTVFREASEVYSDGFFRSGIGGVVGGDVIAGGCGRC